METEVRNERRPVYARLEAMLLESLYTIPLGWEQDTGVGSVFLLQRWVRGFHDPATGQAELANLRTAWRAPS